jgi:hypothetical protein
MRPMWSCAPPSMLSAMRMPPLLLPAPLLKVTSRVMTSRSP